MLDAQCRINVSARRLAARLGAHLAPGGAACRVTIERPVAALRDAWNAAE
jgi:hypothetical protein